MICLFRITVVEDDAYLREELILTFIKGGYDVSGISSFDAPERDIIESKPDLLVLDVNLPGSSGFELCRRLKAKCSFPILILTARDKLDDELTALGLGADDFLTKPCHPKRLLARAERLLQAYMTKRSIIVCGRLSLDKDTYKLTLKDECILLPETEGRIMQALMERSPQLVTQSELLYDVWGTDKYVDENILQVNMTRLRKKLAAAGLDGCIITVRGKGYILEARYL